jgi:leader peptidase (prepilin peptidase) / N-methyltransferase
MVDIFAIFIAGLCWGSFLNVVAIRMLEADSFIGGRSRCVSCKNSIYWYDNIPVLSFLILRGKCRFCQSKISFLYPIFEILTAVVLTILYIKIFSLGSLQDFCCFFKAGKFFVYFLFFSVQIICSITDILEKVIFQIFAFFMVPIGIISSFIGITEISFVESLLAFFLGYLVLFATSKVFKIIAKKEGIGGGDMEFLAMIGAFQGLVGVWFGLAAGSFIAVLVSLPAMIFCGKDRNTMIPFIPFLSLGSFIYFVFSAQIKTIFFPFS